MASAIAGRRQGLSLIGDDTLSTLSTLCARRLWPAATAGVASMA